MILTLQKSLSYSTFVILFNMPLIAISLYPGRTREQKEAFAKAITNAAVEILKTKPEDVIITYDERSKENWYISGEPF
jgi:4-oxalocrotonate tautomerase